MGDDQNTQNNEHVTIGAIDHISAAFSRAALNNVTVCIVSVDTGTSSKVGGNPGAWGYSFPPDHKAHVQYPASDPWVLSVGGTTIGNANGITFDEYVWNDPDPSDPGIWGKRPAGGISDHFDLPSYQNNVRIPNSLNDGQVRWGIRDVSANASFRSGYSGIIVGGEPMEGNGTSASSPLWAGLIAVINAALGKNVGFVNPHIYQLDSGVFGDIIPETV